MSDSLGNSGRDRAYPATQSADHSLLSAYCYFAVRLRRKELICCIRGRSPYLSIYPVRSLPRARRWLATGDWQAA